MMSIKRLGVAITTGVAVIALSGAAASAHVLEVDPPGNGEPRSGWVGGPALPGQGKGLIPGGPGGQIMQSPAHGGGLNTACEALRSNGRSAVDIFGPPSPAGCAHGT